MKKANIVFGIIGLLLSAYVWISSADFPYDKIMILGPEFFPRVMAVAMAIASAGLLVQTFVSGAVGDGKSISLKNPGIRRALIVFVAAVVYAALLPILGFIIDSLLFMMFMMYMLQFRSYGKMFLSSVLRPHDCDRYFRIPDYVADSAACRYFGRHAAVVTGALP